MKASTLVQAILLARILGIEGFGEWGILLSTIAMVGVIASFGIGSTTTKHVAQWRNTEPLRLGRLLSLLQLSALTMGLLTCLALFGWSKQIAEHLLAAPQLAGPLTAIGLIVLLQALSSVYIGVLAGLESFRESAIINAFSTLVGVFLTVVLAQMYGLDGAVVGLLLTALLTAAAFAWRAIVRIRNNGFQLGIRGCSTEWGGIRDYALPIAAASLVAVAAIWLAQLVLVRQPGGYEAMGAYQAANQWRTMVVFLPTQLLSAYLPVLSSLLMADPAHLRRLQNRALGTIMLLTLALALPVVLTAPWLMRLYGADFVPFWPVLVLVALVPIFDIGHVLLQKSAIAQGYAWTMLWPNLAMVAAVSIGAIWLIPEYLGLGLAATLLLGYGSRLFIEYLIYLNREPTTLK
jgi:O-antigen/teichoic acid export membrane protein